MTAKTSSAFEVRTIPTLEIFTKHSSYSSFGEEDKDDIVEKDVRVRGRGFGTTTRVQTPPETPDTWSESPCDFS